MPRRLRTGIDNPLSPTSCVKASAKNARTASLSRGNSSQSNGRTAFAPKCDNWVNQNILFEEIPGLPLKRIGYRPGEQACVRTLVGRKSHICNVVNAYIDCYRLKSLFQILFVITENRIRKPYCGRFDRYISHTR